MNQLHQANQHRWNLAADNWKKMHDQSGTWKQCHQDPSLVFIDKELHYLQHIKNKKVCVLGSGDNLAVLALAGMGAQVCSVDISQNQNQNEILLLFTFPSFFIHLFFLPN